MKKEKRLKEEHKSAVLQAETVNMMTKYQLVFVKMENQFAKIFNNNKLRNIKFKQDAFHKVKRCAILKQSEVGFKAQMIFERFRNKTLNHLINLYSRKLVQEKHLAFQKWRLMVEMPKVQSSIEESQQKEIDVLKQKSHQREKELSDKETGCKQKENQLKQLHSDWKKLKFTIDELEKKERALGQEIQNLIYKNTTSAVENQKGANSVFSKA